MRYFSTSVEVFENTSKETPSFVLMRIAGTESETFSVPIDIFDLNMLFEHAGVDNNN